MTKPLNALIGTGSMGRTHSNAHRTVANFYRLVVACLVLPLFLAVAAADTDEVTTKELKRLQGTWIGTATAVRGSFQKDKKSETVEQKIKVVIEGEKISFFRRRDNEKDFTKEAAGTIAKLDPAQKPAAIDIVGQGGKILAAYQLKDEQTLLLDFGKKPSERPESLDGKTALTLKKQK
jgi:uncharacterized protein (TIGR03067 family)